MLKGSSHPTERLWRACFLTICGGSEDLSLSEWFDTGAAPIGAHDLTPSVVTGLSLT